MGWERGATSWENRNNNDVDDNKNNSQENWVILGEIIGNMKLLSDQRVCVGRPYCLLYRKNRQTKLGDKY